ncbi:hypothetical protein K461DRAFT_280588 [Myriangium duriaei CBS 260.36]|uniref:Uncharacterized protein n=1 Tax=Myriangium duriaei CBS 260.36 TaxID=1168546 RepID=A0A9P4IZC2_9PEZI|nr:hypothetical protein K461DRAFT_280588 [Myriangium duriaei CBS 260.36]
MYQNPVLDVCFAAGMDDLPGAPVTPQDNHISSFDVDIPSSPLPWKPTKRSRTPYRRTASKNSESPAKRRRTPESHDEPQILQSRRRSLVVKLKVASPRDDSHSYIYSPQDDDMIYDNINVASAPVTRPTSPPTGFIEEQGTTLPAEIRMMTPVSHEDTEQELKQELEPIPSSPVVDPMAEMLHRLFSEWQQEVQQNSYAIEARLRQENESRMQKIEFAAEQRHRMQMERMDHLFSSLKQDELRLEDKRQRDLRRVRRRMVHDRRILRGDLKHAIKHINDCSSLHLTKHHVESEESVCMRRKASEVPCTVALVPIQHERCQKPDEVAETIEAGTNTQKLVAIERMVRDMSAKLDSKGPALAEIPALRQEVRHMRKEQKHYAQANERLGCQLGKQIEAVGNMLSSHVSASTTSHQHTTNATDASKDQCSRSAQSSEFQWSETMAASLAKQLPHHLQPLRLQIEDLGGWLNSILPELQSSISSQHCHVWNELATLRSLIRTKMVESPSISERSTPQASQTRDDVAQKFNTTVLGLEKGIKLSYESMRDACQTLSRSVGSLPRLTEERLNSRLEGLAESLQTVTATLESIQTAQDCDNIGEMAPKSNGGPTFQTVTFGSNVLASTAKNEWRDCDEELGVAEATTSGRNEDCSPTEDGRLARKKRRRAERRAYRLAQLEEPVTRIRKDSLCDTDEGQHSKRHRKHSKAKRGSGAEQLETV